MNELTDEGVGFLYKTMLERDPGKRRVKPVQHHLLQLDFGGLEDSSDDSDYEVKETKDSDGSDDIESDEEDIEDGSDSGSNDEDKDAVVDSVHTPRDDDVISLTDSNSLLVGDFTEAIRAGSSVVLSENGASSVSSCRKIAKILICCVCLRDYSEEEDEIVECDGCGVAVHEGCYGISDSQSVASTVSSASTEPWFCEACKAGIKPHCELCPNSGGIFKETDNFRWVHIVCALYIPGVAFGDVDKLSPVTLFEMSYTKWGAKECSLCEDDNFSCTGVCICCDAGMCRNFFHVTCAQKEGLLTEASPDEEIADPFFAYCKQHADKAMARAKHRNHLAICSNMKQSQNWGGIDDKEKTRVQRKLSRHRQKYQISKTKRPPSWQPTVKMPRMLFSSPSATRRLMKKAELLGIHTQTQTHSHKDIRKKWNVPPALSTEFVSYFFDRNDRITTMKKQSQDLIRQREQLQQNVAILRAKYDQLLVEQEESQKEVLVLLKKVQQIYQELSTIGGKPMKMPAALQPKTPIKPVARKQLPRSPVSSGLIHQCSKCGKTNNQHQLARCDTCKLYYHLGCLEPPLTRMPKKTRQMGWQCSECAGSSCEDSDDPDIDPNAPRKLREKIKEPMKFTPARVHLKERRRSEVTKNILKKDKDVTKKRKRSLPAKLISPKVSPKQTLMLAPKLTKPPRLLKSPKTPNTALTVMKKATKTVAEAQKSLDCAVCMMAGDVTNTIVCDKCRLNYHLQCLDPPESKSPRYRGYAWFCAACPTSTDRKEGVTSSSSGRSLKRPSPLRRFNTPRDADIIITKVDTPIYPETKSKTSSSLIKSPSNLAKSPASLSRKSASLPKKRASLPKKRASLSKSPNKLSEKPASLVKRSGKVTAVGMPKTAVNMPKTAVSMPKTAVGMPKTAVSMPKIAVGMPKTAVSMPKTAVGMPKTAVSMPKIAVGMPKTAVGMPKTAVGMPKTAVGMPKTAVGMPKTAVDMPKTAVSMPKTAVSMPKTPVSLSAEPSVVPVKLFASRKFSPGQRASAIRMKSPESVKSVLSLADQSVKNELLEISASSENLESIAKSDIHHADACQEVIVLDDDDDEDDEDEYDDDDIINVARFKGSSDNLPSTKVMMPEGSTVVDMNPGSPVKVSPRCGLPSRVKRPMILSKGTKVTAEVTESKKQKLDFDDEVIELHLD